VVDDQVISDPVITLVDPEYNQRDLSLVWSDAVGNLWLAQLDPVTGYVPAYVYHDRDE